MPRVAFMEWIGKWLFNVTSLLEGGYISGKGNNQKGWYVKRHWGEIGVCNSY